jgi:cell division protein FtsB
MQPTRVEGEGTEAEQLRERIWTYAQRGVVMAVVFFAGLFVGYQLWGQATQLREQVDDLTERNQSLVKERDTERSKVTLVERDKKELERQLDDMRAKLAAAGGKPDAMGGGTAPAPGGSGGGTQGVTIE